MTHQSNVESLLRVKEFGRLDGQFCLPLTNDCPERIAQPVVNVIKLFGSACQSKLECLSILSFVSLQLRPTCLKHLSFQSPPLYK